MLALVGQAPSKNHLLNYLRDAQVRTARGSPYSGGTIDPALSDLVTLGLVIRSSTGTLQCADALLAPAIQLLITRNALNRFCAAVEANERVPIYSNQLYLTSFPQGLLRLHVELVRGSAPDEVHKWLAAISKRFSCTVHPYATALGRPFNKSVMTLLHPEIREEVMAELLNEAHDSLEDALQMREWSAQRLAGPGEHNARLINSLAEQWLLCGRLDKAAQLVEARNDSDGQACRSVILLLKGDLAGAISGFESALKLLRQSSGKRNAVFINLYGYLYVLALLRSDEAALRKKAENCLNLALRAPGAKSSPFASLEFLLQVQAGTRKAIESKILPAPVSPLAKLFSLLVEYWLGVALTQERKALLVDLWRSTEASGSHFITAQAAELLSRQVTGVGSGYRERASTLRRELGIDTLIDWFERQEPWQRQLAALANLQASGETVTDSSQSRLVWMLNYLPKIEAVSLAPREQKRKGKGNWTGGRAVSLKRLYDSDDLDFLTDQDRQVCAGIERNYDNYYGGDYELDGHDALAQLIGHPLVFWHDLPEVRVEILRGEPELLIKKTAGDTLTLRLHPPLDILNETVLISKETPTRLRVIKVTDELRRIASILGKELTVPARAREQVLAAISSISSLITIQSDIHVLPSNVEQVEADNRLHVHLLPHADGLKLQVLVRPFATDGPYYTPGAGAESVIAEIAGKPLQARRNLADETRAASQLTASCPALLEAGDEHGERTLEDPVACLELLLQLQAQPEKVLIAWPEGEKFKVSREVGSSRFSVSIKRDIDWFAAGGELQVDDNQVIDLRKLLDLMGQARGRFIPLGDNQFLALTDEFRRRLDELRAFSDPHAHGVRVHPLAASALEELANSAGNLKADKHWKSHLDRLRELDTLAPQLPATLQADLRDYQVAGFNWLSRLAHWGVGACLADDMGLGKTLQALALLLERAPQGPALVVAPTSVCMNWMSEIARFAPTLKVILFGSGDRNLTLADLNPFDLVIASYGLLQQEADRFTAVHWHTIVLDEAQAIKNHQTKRSQSVMALNGDFRMICTGTPLENHLGELWNLFRFINPGLLGSLEHFNERYAGPIERQQDAAARNRLRKLIAPFLLRRTKSQVLSELPSRTEILRQVEMSEQEIALYEALRREALERLASIDLDSGGHGGQKNIQILAEIMKLRRACCNPQLVAPALGLPSSKLAAFGELLDELLDNRHKALVFSQFVDHLSLIRNYLDGRGVSYQYLDGSTPMQERKVRVDAFQAGAGDVFLISLKAGGTGLNLTAADYVIHMDPWWNPAVEDQASDRAHRIGQTRPVTIYRLVAKQTIEEKIVDLHKHKRALADSLLEGSDLAARMSADDMLQLLQEEMRNR
ncbi:DEAD/DEAH box helicase [Propionivibrio sp.]|uniref:DEAD/DEAH box helicase n=1 Tax=Propionivibrio sp. TaxID=2212460 RepID=UPI003BF5B373